MTTLSGAANSSANAIGGTGGPAVISQGPPPGSGGGGGANAQSTAISGLSGDATSSSTATGGAGNAVVGPGGDASASSAATSNGSGNALSSASATGGDYGPEAFPVIAGDATAMANALATVGGTATAKAVAAGATFLGYVEPGVAANATSNAETANGALSVAQSTALGSSGQAQSTAKTGLAGVSAQSRAVAPIGSLDFGNTATTNAVAQGGSGQAFVNPGQTAYAFSTALPDKAYSATLIGGASHVASGLLGPRDALFGTAILGANYAPDGGGESNTYSASSTFDFGYRGDLQLGLIDDQVSGFANGLGFQSMEFTIMADGVEVLDVTFGSLAIAESFFRDDVIDLGANFGPNIDLTFGYTLVADGSGGFGFDLAIGGAVPEPSTWAMMLVGFAGLGFAGYRPTRRSAAAGVRA
jgi:PEP-CTERM motif